MRRTRTLMLASVALSTSVACSTMAQAQTAGGASATAVSEVIVTAQKRSENVRDVPETVNVVGAVKLEEARVATLSDVSALVPGLEVGSFSGAAQSFVSLRGMSPQTFGDPTVVVFVDGFTANSNTTAALPLFDLERVEVLKGPQGTLYGANSLGGAINLITRKPTDKFEANLEASYGEHNTEGFHGSVSGPVVPGLLDALASGGYEYHDGYWPNLVYPGTRPDFVRNINGHFALRLTPGHNFTSELEYLYNRLHEGCGDCVNPIVGYDPAPPTNLSSIHNVNNLEPFVDENIPGFERRNVDNIIWTNTLVTGFATLTSITGYSNIHFDEELDFDRGPTNSAAFPGFYLPTKLHAFSQEVRVASAGSGPLQWLFGGYYFHSQSPGKSFIFTPPSTFFLFDTFAAGVKNYAVFGNVSYELPLGLQIGAGLRYDVETKDAIDTFIVGHPSVTSHELLPKFTLRYGLDERNNLYASVSRGYKTGGINTFGPPGFEFYRPEFVWTYEVGEKGQSGDGRLAYDVAAYYTDWTNQQVQEAEGFFTFIGNAGKTRVYGFEASGQFQPIERLSIDATINYNHSRYVVFSDPTSEPVFFGFSKDLAGHKPALAPDWSGSVSAQYVQPLTGDLDVTGRVDARYTGARSTDTDGFAQASGYALVNASISLGTKRIRVTAFANNLFNQRYATYTALFAGIFPSAHLGAPRVVGIQLDAKY